MTDSNNSAGSAQHTPGPWTFEPGTIDDFPYVIYGEDCLCVESGKDSDARLIAAAPDLLEALERTLSWLTSYKGEGTMGPNGPYEQARAAISKATGTTS